MFAPVVDFLTQWIAAHPQATFFLLYGTVGGGMGFYLGYLVLSNWESFVTHCAAEGRPVPAQKGLFWTGMLMGLVFWPVFAAGFTFYCLARGLCRLAYGVAPTRVHVSERAVFPGDGPGWVRAEFPERK